MNSVVSPAPGMAEERRGGRRCLAADTRSDGARFGLPRPTAWATLPLPLGSDARDIPRPAHPDRLATTDGAVHDALETRRSPRGGPPLRPNHPDGPRRRPAQTGRGAEAR